MDEKQQLKADVKIAEIRQHLKLLDYKIQVIQDNHLKHLKEKIDFIYKILFVVGVGVFTQLLIIIRNTFLS
jgi:hypothetical protein|tara:strand:- start:267 stop:479 length:213 start_codon:yes stop_codon:yes gene_type:complete